MLFKQAFLDGIKTGKVNLAFRKWKKLAVKEGSQIKTGIGLVEVGKIVIVKENQIKDVDAKKAGFDNAKQLIKSLSSIEIGDIYKIQVRYYSPDPRIKLREQTKLTDNELLILKQKLNQLDRRSKQGYWTENILTAIEENPKLRAVELAKLTGKEKVWLKLNIRKLKNLGLTISYHPGYTLSELGKVYLRSLE